jgi:amino acid transporter
MDKAKTLLPHFLGAVALMFIRAQQSYQTPEVVKAWIASILVLFVAASITTLIAWAIFNREQRKKTTSAFIIILWIFAGVLTLQALFR